MSLPHKRGISIERTGSMSRNHTSCFESDLEQSSCQITSNEGCGMHHQPEIVYAKRNLVTISFRA